MNDAKKAKTLNDIMMVISHAMDLGMSNEYQMADDLLEDLHHHVNEELLMDPEEREAVVLLIQTAGCTINALDEARNY